MKQRLRFKHDGTWTRWYDGDEDLSFLRSISSIEAVEVSEEMTRDELAKSHPDIAAQLRQSTGASL